MRLIDADALPVKFWFGHFFGVAEIDIVNAPTVDAVEVVRCKDCVNCSECITDDGMHSYIRCLWKGATICENDYCSWGERREDAVK